MQFAWDIFGVVDARLRSRSTIHRNLVRMGLSLKVLKRRNINRCNIEGVHFLDRIAHRNPLHCIVIDETASSPQAFYAKHGGSPVGDECIQLQFVVGG